MSRHYEIKSELSGMITDRINAFKQNNPAAVALALNSYLLKNKVNAQYRDMLKKQATIDILQKEVEGLKGELRAKLDLPSYNWDVQSQIAERATESMPEIKNLTELNKTLPLRLLTAGSSTRLTALIEEIKTAVAMPIKKKG